MHHLVVLFVAAGAVPLLLGSRWTHRAPRTAVILWQAITLTVALSVIGLILAIGLAPYERGVVPGLGVFVSDVISGGMSRPMRADQVSAVIFGLLLAGWLVLSQARCSLRAARQRARHRQLLQLVARADADIGALVLDHPIATAYCLPGRSPDVVISAGAQRLLSGAELRSVLAHEQSHARERHHLVLTPFRALCGALPGSRTATKAFSSVGLLVEMCADDSAARRHGAGSLVAALERFQGRGDGAAPACGLAAAATAIPARIHRLRHPQPRLNVAIRSVAVLAALTMLATSASLFAHPL